MTVQILSALGVHAFACSSGLHRATCEKIREYSMVGVRCSMFDVFWYWIFQNSPFSAVFAFSWKSNCPPLSRLMGGQFPLKKELGTLKNPLFFDGCHGPNRSKIELSFLSGKNPPFFTKKSENFRKKHVFSYFWTIGRRKT